MNWLTNFVRPKIRALVSRDIPEDLWEKCPGCEQMLFRQDLDQRLRVCKQCGYHLRLTAIQRLDLLFNTYTLLPLPPLKDDPLHFRDTKRYADRLKEARRKSSQSDAIAIGVGEISTSPTPLQCVIAAFDFGFMGGSMGRAVGEGIILAASQALKANCALILIPASGGARMQEGILSLMQMPRTVIAISTLKQQGLPLINILGDPTMGGVAASFAMLGDFTLAEPAALIGFTGPRVLKQTIKKELPAGFQTAEYLLSHGFIDQVVPRHEMKPTIQRFLNILAHRPAPPFD